MLVRQNGSVPLQSAATTTATGSWIKCYGPAQAYQVVVVGTAGAYSATVVIEGSNDGTTAVAVPLGTITISGTGTTAASDGFATGLAPWAWIRARVSAISGTGANASTWMGT
jgi:hypothetical protein